MLVVVMGTATCKLVSGENTKYLTKQSSKKWNNKLNGTLTLGIGDDAEIHNLKLKNMGRKKKHVF